MATGLDRVLRRDARLRAGDPVRHLLRRAGRPRQRPRRCLPRAPSMIITLGTNAVAQGLMVVPHRRLLAAGRRHAADARAGGRPSHSRRRQSVLIWAMLGAATVFLLTRTTLGRQIYAIGNRERAVFLSGVDTRRVARHLLRHLRRHAPPSAACCWRAGPTAPARRWAIPTCCLDRRGGAWRHLRPGRPGHLSRHDRRRDPDHAAAVDPVGGPAADMLADLGLKVPPESIRQIVFGHRHRRHAAALRPQPGEPVERHGDGRRRGRASLPRVIVVMGVAGCGKTVVGSALATALGWRFVEGDRFHPVGKHRADVGRLPLSDEHRWGWLDAIGVEIALAPRLTATALVAACSALKRVYRDRLRRASPDLLFIHLDDRQGHRRRKGGRAQGPFHAGEPGRQPVRRTRAAGSRRNRVIVRRETSGRRAGRRGCCGASGRQLS